MPDLVKDADDAPFERTMRDKHRVLYHLLPDRKTELKHDLRQHRHAFTLTQKQSDTWQIAISLPDYFTKTAIDTTRM